jgi:outer membrane immunogenic protein
MLRSVLLASAFAVCAAAPAFAAPVQTWTGFYAGINAGYGGDKFTYPANGTFTDTTADDDVDATTTFNGSAKVTSGGFLGGGQVGYNYQFANGVILGGEADIAGSDIKGKATLSGSAIGGTAGNASAKISSSLDYLGTVRARAGWPILDGRVVPFASGGFAYGQVTSSASLDIIPAAGQMASATKLALSQHSTPTGWTVGAGADFALTDRLSFRAEYLYVDLGTKTLLGGSTNLGQNLGNIGAIGDSDETLAGSLKVKTTANVLRVALNYRF